VITLTSKSSEDQRGKLAAAPPDASMDLNDVTGIWPRWQTWRGVVAGMVYARRLKTSPPAIVRAHSPAALAAAIWMHEHARIRRAEQRAAERAQIWPAG
jgi:hypothetical protein